MSIEEYTIRENHYGIGIHYEGTGPDMLFRILMFRSMGKEYPTNVNKCAFAYSRPLNYRDIEFYNYMHRRFDQWVYPYLSQSEENVLRYIIQHTTARKRYAEAIHTMQFLNGMDMVDRGARIKSRTSLIKAIKDLKARGFISIVEGKKFTVNYHTIQDWSLQNEDGVFVRIRKNINTTEPKDRIRVNRNKYKAFDSELESEYEEEFDPLDNEEEFVELHEVFRKNDPRNENSHVQKLNTGSENCSKNGQNSLENVQKLNTIQYRSNNTGNIYNTNILASKLGNDVFDEIDSIPIEPERTKGGRPATNVAMLSQEIKQRAADSKAKRDAKLSVSQKPKYLTEYFFEKLKSKYPEYPRLKPCSKDYGLMKNLVSKVQIDEPMSMKDFLDYAIENWYQIKEYFFQWRNDRSERKQEIPEMINLGFLLGNRLTFVDLFARARANDFNPHAYLTWKLRKEGYSDADIAQEIEYKKQQEAERKEAAKSISKKEEDLELKRKEVERLKHELEKTRNYMATKRQELDSREQSIFRQEQDAIKKQIEQQKNPQIIPKLQPPVRKYGEGVLPKVLQKCANRSEVAKQTAIAYNVDLATVEYQLQMYGEREFIKYLEAELERRWNFYQDQLRQPELFGTHNPAFPIPNKPDFPEEYHVY